MGNFVNYLFEVNLGLILFLFLYTLLLKNETNFSFKRGYLLVSIFISILFPLLKIGVHDNNIPSISHVVPSYMLPEIVVTDGQQASEIAVPQFLTIWKVIEYSYVAGVALFMIRFLLRLTQLVFHIIKSRAYHFNNKYKIVEIREPFPTFSFFNYIFIGQADQLINEDKELIVRHEIIHVDKFHSIDVLLLEALTIAFWFNPFIIVYKKIFITLHEFQADQKAVECYDVNQYCNLLARVALMSADFKLANHFNNSLTLKRITMMKIMKKKMSTWKVAAIVPIVVGFFFVVACQDQILHEATEIAKGSTMAFDVPKDVQKKFEELQRSKPDKKFVIIETDAQGNAKLDNMKSVLDEGRSNEKFSSITVITPTAKNSEPVRTFMILEYNSQVKEVAERSKSQDGVFTIVEQPASFVGGMEGLMTFMSQNLKYPQKAIGPAFSEGKVYVQFIVNTDGTVVEPIVLKGLDPALDEEALRVVRLLPKWIPGMQNGQAVRSKFVLPIAFKDTNKSQMTEMHEETNDFKVGFVSISEQGNNKIIKGKVFDDKGAPLAGSNIINVGTTQGTTSDANGDFAIQVPKSEGRLAISYVGYKTQTIDYHVDR